MADVARLLRLITFAMSASPGTKLNTWRPIEVVRYALTHLEDFARDRMKRHAVLAAGGHIVVSQVMYAHGQAPPGTEEAFAAAIAARIGDAFASDHLQQPSSWPHSVPPPPPPHLMRMEAPGSR